MPITKVTNLFKMSTIGTGEQATGRSGGWSEGWYFNGDISGAITKNTAGGGLAQTRARLLCATASIIGQRYQLVSPLPVGPSVSRGKEFPGDPNFPTDIPQMALLSTMTGVGVANVKHHIMRGLPDIMVLFGEFIPTQSYKSKLFDYFQALAGFSFKGLDLSVAKVAIISFNEVTGLVTTAAAHGFAVDEEAGFTGLKELPNDPASQQTRQVIEVPSSTTFKVLPRPLGRTFVIGFVRRKVSVYPAVDPTNSDWERVITRKVGRPFDQFRGRR